MPTAFVSILTFEYNYGSRIILSTMTSFITNYLSLLDVHPYSVCQKLGSKYGSVPAVDLKERHDFYEDLLRYEFCFARAYRHPSTHFFVSKAYEDLN